MSPTAKKMDSTHAADRDRQAQFDRYVAGIDVDLLVAETLLRTHLRDAAAEYLRSNPFRLSQHQRRRSVSMLRRSLTAAAQSHRRQQSHINRVGITTRQQRQLITETINRVLEQVEDSRQTAGLLLQQAAAGGLYIGGPGAWPGARSLLIQLLTSARRRPQFLSTRADWATLLQRRASNQAIPRVNISRDMERSLDSLETVTTQRARSSREHEQCDAPIVAVYERMPQHDRRVHAVLAAGTGLGILGLLIGSNNERAVVISSEGRITGSTYAQAPGLLGSNLFQLPAPTGAELQASLRLPLGSR